MATKSEVLKPVNQKAQKQNQKAQNQSGMFVPLAEKPVGRVETDT
jgi:hypothetical protein